MKNSLLTRFTQEQLLCVGMIPLCALLLWMTSSSASVDASGSVSLPPRASSFPVVSEWSPLKGDVKVYEPGKTLTAPAGKMRQSIPEIVAPNPTAESLALPMFMPNADLYGLLQSGVKWPHRYLKPAAPPIPAADLDEGALASVLAQKQPEFQIRKDMRDEMEPKEDTVVDDQNKSHFGQLMERDKSFRPDTDRIILIQKDPKTGQVKQRPFGPGLWTGITLSKSYYEHYKEESRKCADNLQARWKLAVKLIEEWGMIPEAKVELNMIVDRKPDHMEAIERLVKLHLEALEFEAALQMLDKAVKRVTAPDRVRPLKYWRGVVWQKFGLLDRALVEFHEAYASMPEAGLEKARILRSLKKHKEAVDTANSVLALQNVSPALLTRTCSLKALCLLEKGAPLAEVSRCVDDAVKYDAANAEALNVRGILKAAASDFKGAHADFAAAIAANQYHSEAWFNLALLYIGGMKTDKANEILAAGMERDPLCAEFYTAQGVADFVKDNLAGARSKFEKALSMQADLFYPQYALGTIDLREDRPDLGLVRFNDAIKLEYYFPPLYYNAALIHYTTALTYDRGRKISEKKGEVEQAKTLARLASGALVTAEALLRKSLDLNPGDRNAIVALSILYLSQNRIAEGNEVLSKIPNDVRADDPMVLFLEGAFVYQGSEPNVETRMTHARAKMQEAAEKGSVEGTEWFKKIDAWLLTYVLLEEQFNRTESGNVGAGWNDNDKDAFPIEITKQGRCRFSSKIQPNPGANKDSLYMSMERQIPGENFYSMELTFYPARFRKMEMFGVALLAAQPGDNRGVMVGFQYNTLTDRPRVAVMPSIGEQQLRAPARLSLTWNKDLVVSKEEIRIRIAVNRPPEAPPTLEIKLWDKDKKDWVPCAMGMPYQASGKSFKLSIFARAGLDSDFEFEVDDVIVLERRQE